MKPIVFDCEDQFKNFGKQIPENCELILRDVRSISGADLVREYGVPAVLFASPPCQEFSYMAMPWAKAKEKQRKIENVRGAQKWVGKAKWNFGSFYLWGDVPALMPIPGKIRMKSKISCAARRFDERVATTPEEAHALHYRLPEGVKAGISWSKSGPGNPGQSFQTASILKSEGNKTAGMNWSDPTAFGKNILSIPGRKKGVSFTDAAGFKAIEGSKGFHDFYDAPIAQFGSKSSKRKQASAEIAKIPPALASWIAKIFNTPKNP